MPRLTRLRKYGSPHRQLRALVILDDLIQNAGPAFQRRFADEPLLERLRLMVTEPVTDIEVKEKCNSLYRQWAVAYKDTPGMQDVASLYKQLPQRKRKPKPQPQPSDDPFDNEEPSLRERSGSIQNQAARQHGRNTSVSGPSSGPSYASPVAPIDSRKDKRSIKDRAKPFKFEKEKAQITQVLTQANLEATGLMNSMKLLDKEKERVSQNPAIRQRYDVCKALHRQLLRYCNLVTDENYLGALLQANDAAAEATALYEQLDRSFDYDSDSEDYDSAPPSAKAKAPISPMSTGASNVPSSRSRMASLSLNEAVPSMPPRSSNPSFTISRADDAKGKSQQATPLIAKQEEEEDENDPFADRNEISTPRAERDGFRF